MKIPSKEEVKEEEEKEKRGKQFQSLLRLRALRNRKAHKTEATESPLIDLNGNCVGDRIQECFYCGEVTSQECRHCREVYYCSEEHLSIHRPTDYCHPFIVRRDPVVGRYTVASRDISPCELILSEDAAVAGPYTRTQPVCLQCYAQIDGSYRCDLCNFPVCDSICARGPVHRQECDYFVSKKYQFKPKFPRNPSSIYSCITLLRMLLTKHTDPVQHKRIHFLTDHTEGVPSRHRSPQQLELHMANFLTNLGSRGEFSDQEIHRNIGILRTNGMKLEQRGLKDHPGVVLYPTYCLINHACSNNTNYFKFPDLHLELRSQVSIKRGEEITTRYVSSTLGNYRRGRDISKYWYFSCSCVRCSSPTELGTHMSSIRCQSPSSCPGLVSPCSPLDPLSPWSCDTCSKDYSSHQVQELMDSVETVLDQEDTSDPDTLEELIHRYGDHAVLHPNHYLVVELMHSLVFAYSNLRPILTRPQHERVIQLCSHILEVLGKVDPGFTQWKGTMLTELVASLVLTSKSDLATGSIPQSVYQRRLYYCCLNLATAKKCNFRGFSKVTT